MHSYFTVNMSRKEASASLLPDETGDAHPEPLPELMAEESASTQPPPPGKLPQKIIIFHCPTKMYYTLLTDRLGEKEAWRPTHFS